MRERDVAAAFERASQEVVRLRPDVVVVAGDVFDRPDLHFIEGITVYVGTK